MNTFNQIPFCIADVGAMGGIHPRWSPYKNFKSIGFEPDPREFQKLEKNKNQEWICSAIYKDNGQYNFYQLRQTCNSSLLKPNISLVKNLAYKIEDFDIINTINIQTQSIDEVSREHQLSINFLKLDTQGSELGILQGSINSLKTSILALEIEVEFLPLYENQPLFGDIQYFFKDLPFQLMDIGNQLHVKYKNTPLFYQRKSNLISGDALYFISPDYLIENRHQYGVDKFASIIPIAMAYGYQDYLYFIFNKLKEVDLPFYTKVSEFTHSDILMALKNNLESKFFKISERKYSKIRNFIDKYIKPKDAHWHYGIGNNNFD